MRVDDIGLIGTVALNIGCLDKNNKNEGNFLMAGTRFFKAN
ncbi:hypothetical protein [Burkholderia stagnalis]|nr:hypothetical protein [Burkholderia stagnalis]